MKKKTLSNAAGQRGYTLLFAVIVAVLVLSVATFIVSISRKQFLLSSAARDSLYAFYAADTGLECAINNFNAFSTSSGPYGNTITCGVSKTSGAPGVWPTTFTAASNGAASTSFSMYTGANDSGAPSCAFVMVEIWPNPASPGSVIESFKSRGYNLGYNGTDCSVTSPRKVERAIQILYQ